MAKIVFYFHYLFQNCVKMETQRKVKDAVQLNDWAFSLDLTDAYLHIPIHYRSRKFLRFTLRSRVYQFKALPFGLSTSPFVFTRLMEVIATFLRRRAITLHPYLDDWLARNQNHRRLLEHRQFILSLINSLGLIINYQIYAMSVCESEKNDLSEAVNPFFRCIASKI